MGKNPKVARQAGMRSAQVSGRVAGLSRSKNRRQRRHAVSHIQCQPIDVESSAASVAVGTYHAVVAQRDRVERLPGNAASRVSAGVLKARVSRGLVFSLAAISSSWG